MSGPTISIITPSLNSGWHIVEAARTIDLACARLLAEDSTLIVEHIIVDNGSDDEETLSAYDVISRGPRPCTTVLRYSEKRGAASARNVGIRCSSGFWLSFLDADDRFDPDGFCALIEMARRHPSPLWLIADAEAFFSDGTTVRKTFLSHDFASQSGLHSQLISQRQAIRIMAGPTSCFLGSMLIGRKLLMEHDLFDERFKTGEDWLLNLKLASSTGFRYVPSKVLEFRRGHMSLTQDPRSIRITVIAAKLAALFDPRFKGVRRTLRWTLLTQIKSLRDDLKKNDCRFKAFGYGIIAWVFAPEDLRLFATAVKCLFRPNVKD